MGLKVFLKLKTLKTLSSGQIDKKKKKTQKTQTKTKKNPTGLGFFLKNLGFFQPCLVQHVHAVVPPLHRQDGRRFRRFAAALFSAAVEKVADVFGVDGGRGDDEFEIPTSFENLFQET
jgi:hypothetical protein